MTKGDGDMAKDRVQTDSTDVARRMQALFNLNELAAPQIERAMTLQENLLRQSEIFARHWVERRQEAAETGMQALREIRSRGTADPVTAVTAVTDWQRGSLKRMNADLEEWVALCTGVAQQAAPNGDEAGDARTAGEDTARPEGGGQDGTRKARGRSASTAGARPATSG